MTNLPNDIIGKAKNLIFKFELGKPDFKNIDDGQAYTLNYEKKRYRQKELADIVFSALPFFALKEEEYLDFHERNKSPQYFISEAIKRIVKPGKRAGDYGEIILFLLLELFYGSKKIVTKVFYKTASEVPVFGADAAHFTIESDGDITFWFGESKFYHKFSDALTAAFNSVDEFLKLKLKDEIQFLTPSRIEINKDTDKELFNKVVGLIEDNVSLDDLRIKIPVLITYELRSLGDFDDISADNFLAGMKKEFEDKFKLIQNKNWQKYYKNVSIVFFLLPIHDVRALKDLIRKKDEGIRI